jgi:3-oxoacyl-[acyl-carrier protein] reductase
MQNRLSDKVAIVTGASRGIGKAIAKLYADEGAKVLAVFHSDEPGALSTLEGIKATGGEASLFQADVSKKADTERMAEEALRLYGRVDVLCSNAGIYPLVKIEDMTEDDWDLVLSVNLKGTFLAVKACLPQMQAQNYGRIVCISSTTGPRTGVPGLAHYGASKNGIIGFIRNACLEFGKYNITINAVEPGAVLTEGAKVALDEATISEIEKEIPLKRFADPLDIAYAALFLATDESKYITGQSIVVDGGLILPEMPLHLFE